MNWQTRLILMIKSKCSLNNNILFFCASIVFYCFFLSSSWTNEIEYKRLEKKEGLYYKILSDTPYTGKVVGQINGKIVNGKKEGLHLKFYKNGKILSKANFKKNRL